MAVILIQAYARLKIHVSLLNILTLQVLNVNDSVSFHINVHFSDHLRLHAKENWSNYKKKINSIKLSPLHILPSLSISSPQKPHGCSKANKSDLNT